MELLQTDPRGPDVAAAGRRSRSTSRRRRRRPRPAASPGCSRRWAGRTIAGDVLAYGTVIATGNAVVEWVPMADAECRPRSSPACRTCSPATRRRAGPSSARATRTVGDRLRAAGVETVAAALDAVVHRARAPGAVRRPAARHGGPTRTGTATTTGTSTTTSRSTPSSPTAGPTRSTPPGMQARRTLYEGFPVDTGTIVASRLLDPHGQGRWALVSCNLYADAVGDGGGRGGRGARGAGPGPPARRRRRQRAVLRAHRALDHPRRGPRRRRPRPLEPQGPRRDPGRRPRRGPRA